MLAHTNRDCYITQMEWMGKQMYTNTNNSLTRWKISMCEFLCKCINIYRSEAGVYTTQKEIFYWIHTQIQNEETEGAMYWDDQRLKTWLEHMQWHKCGEWWKKKKAPTVCWSLKTRKYKALLGDLCVIWNRTQMWRILEEEKGRRHTHRGVSLYQTEI